MSKKLKIALPKGSLQDSTVELFRKAGYNVYVSSRGYRPTCDDDDLELFLIRAQEIGRYVNDGFIDCGITGRDWIYENRADVEVLTDLQYSKATSKPTRWVLVVPENSPITCAEDLQGKRIATEGVGITERWLQEKGIKALVEALPSLRRPTISHLAEEGWLAVETVIDESVVRDIIPQLKALGAEGIIEYPLNKLVY